MSTDTAGRPRGRDRHAPAAGVPRARRYWEVDLARTVAIAMMVVFHAGYDLDFLMPDSGIEPRQGGWLALQIATGSLFLFVVGVSFTISDAAAIRRGLTWRQRVAKHVRRGALVLGCGMLISLVTWIALDDRYVRFGILHVIGVSVILAPFVVGLGIWNAPLGVAAIGAGLLLRGAESDVPGLLVLGWRPPGGAGVDYYPLLPWFGVVLLGLAAGTALYPAGRRGRWGDSLPRHAPDLLTAPGRHSLVFYLVHQPVLIALLVGILTVVGADWSWPD